jgi:hypothetical protein
MYLMQGIYRAVAWLGADMSQKETGQDTVLFRSHMILHNL